MADLAQNRKEKKGVKMWSCYIPLEAEFNAEQKPQKQYMFKINRNTVINNDFLDGNFAQNYEK